LHRTTTLETDRKTTYDLSRPIQPHDLEDVSQGLSGIDNKTGYQRGSYRKDLPFYDKSGYYFQGRGLGRTIRIQNPHRSFWETATSKKIDYRKQTVQKLEVQKTIKRRH